MLAAFAPFFWLFTFALPRVALRGGEKQCNHQRSKSDTQIRGIDEEKQRIEDLELTGIELVFHRFNH